MSPFSTVSDSQCRKTGLGPSKSDMWVMDVAKTILWYVVSQYTTCTLSEDRYPSNVSGTHSHIPGWTATTRRIYLDKNGKRTANRDSLALPSQCMQLWIFFQHSSLAIDFPVYKWNYHSSKWLFLITWLRCSQWIKTLGSTDIRMNQPLKRHTKHWGSSTETGTRILIHRKFTLLYAWPIRQDSEL